MRIFFPLSMIMAILENTENSISPSNDLISEYGLGKKTNQISWREHVAKRQNEDRKWSSTPTTLRGGGVGGHWRCGGETYLS
jgi:hypothetical protein